jgi:hypothetical protein
MHVCMIVPSWGVQCFQAVRARAVLGSGCAVMGSSACGLGKHSGGEGVGGYLGVKGVPSARPQITVIDPKHTCSCVRIVFGVL